MDIFKAASDAAANAASSSAFASAQSSARDAAQTWYKNIALGTGTIVAISTIFTIIDFLSLGNIRDVFCLKGGLFLLNRKIYTPSLPRIKPYIHRFLTYEYYHAGIISFIIDILLFVILGSHLERTVGTIQFLWYALILFPILLGLFFVTVFLPFSFIFSKLSACAVGLSGIVFILISADANSGSGPFETRTIGGITIVGAMWPYIAFIVSIFFYPWSSIVLNFGGILLGYLQGAGFMAKLGLPASVIGYLESTRLASWLSERTIFIANPNPDGGLPMPGGYGTGPRHVMAGRSFCLQNEDGYFSDSPDPFAKSVFGVKPLFSLLSKKKSDKSHTNTSPNTQRKLKSVSVSNRSHKYSTPKKKKNDLIVTSDEDEYDENRNRERLNKKKRVYSPPKFVMELNLDDDDSNDSSSTEYCTDLDADIPGFIDDEVKPSTSESIELPVEFINGTEQGNFSVVFQYVVLLVLNANVGKEIFAKDHEETYFRPSLRFIGDRLDGYRNLLKSAVWKKTFLRALNHYPRLHTTEQKYDGKCAACGKTSYPAHNEITFDGKPYNRNTLGVQRNLKPPKKKQQSQIIDEDTISISGSESSESDFDEREESMSFFVGRSCLERAELYHQLTHYVRSMYQRVRREIVKMVARKDVADVKIGDREKIVGEVMRRVNANGERVIEIMKDKGFFLQTPPLKSHTNTPASSILRSSLVVTVVDQFRQAVKAVHSNKLSCIDATNLLVCRNKESFDNESDLLLESTDSVNVLDVDIVSDEDLVGKKAVCVVAAKKDEVEQAMALLVRLLRKLEVEMEECSLQLTPAGPERESLKEIAEKIYVMLSDDQ
ncbi:hypothetical protein HK098_007541 [Nowakowskiella sp. JEL0407]|nr:hypothetical protein HK098_007541 [Nowakowskiella sp. JEL0407]